MWPLTVKAYLGPEKIDDWHEALVGEMTSLFPNISLNLFKCHVK